MSGLGDHVRCSGGNDFALNLPTICPMTRQPQMGQPAGRLQMTDAQMDRYFRDSH